MRSNENRRLVLQCMLRRIRVYGNISFQPSSIACRLCKGPNCERLGERAKTGPARDLNPVVLFRTALQPCNRKHPGGRPRNTDWLQGR